MSFSTKNTSLGLATDLYQITMAYGYFKNGMANRWANFDLYFRNLPLNSDFAIACGLQNVVDYLEAISENWFSDDDIYYLRSLKGGDDKELFSEDFLKFLRNSKLNVNLRAIKEGTPVFPNEPILSVSGPIYQCQLLETFLLNQINFSTLIATKAHLVCRAAGQDPVFEFGFRRAQGFDGAMTASRACYAGGCAGTSNVLAGKEYGIPVKGTMAHSWIMSFDDELQAINAYADAMPNNCVILVDTYDVVNGTYKAIEVGRKLRNAGKDLYGIRIDSGDLLYESRKARSILDNAGFTKTKIIASNDLDEKQIITLKYNGARIDAWGVGTKLITSYDQPALGGVYKLSAIHDKLGKLRNVIKLSSTKDKTSMPGIKEVIRFENTNETYSHDELLGFNDATRPGVLKLTANIIENGKRIIELPDINNIRNNLNNSISRFDWARKPRYEVFFSDNLIKEREKLINRAKEGQEMDKFMYGN